MRLISLLVAGLLACTQVSAAPIVRPPEFNRLTRRSSTSSEWLNTHWPKTTINPQTAIPTIGNPNGFFIPGDKSLPTSHPPLSHDTPSHSHPHSLDPPPAPPSLHPHSLDTPPSTWPLSAPPSPHPPSSHDTPPPHSPLHLAHIRPLPATPSSHLPSSHDTNPLSAPPRSGGGKPLPVIPLGSARSQHRGGRERGSNTRHQPNGPRPRKSGIA